jgi:hypothetical protein
MEFVAEIILLIIIPTAVPIPTPMVMAGAGKTTKVVLFRALPQIQTGVLPLLPI